MAKRRYRYIERVVLDRYELGSAPLNELTVFVRVADGVPLLLPLLFSAFLSKNGFLYREQRNQEANRTFIPSFVRRNTIQNYLSCLHLFLDTLEDFAASSSLSRTLTPSGDNLQLVDQALLATYLNEFLPRHCGSFKTLKVHQAALQAFFDWLTYFGFREGLEVPLRRSAQDRLGKPLKSKDGVIQYVSREFRRQLLLECRNKRDRLVLRTGYELGLRASENLGLVLFDQRIGRSKKPGLKKLFSKLEESDDLAVFEYWLHGRHCKGGKSRPITISSDLLRDMKDYFETERRQALRCRGDDSNHLFVNYGRQSRVPISPQFPTNLFRSARSRVPHMDQGLSYQDLRHTFATELFASLVTSSSVADASRALTIVQDALGHSSSRSTEIYVHLFEKMLAVEELDMGECD